MLAEMLAAPTRRGAVAIGERAGLHPRAITEIVAEGASARHAARVAATLAASAEAATVEGIDGPIVHPALQAGLLAADLIGCGGPLGLGGPGGATARLPYARSLGSGRWQARDGGAYRAAAEWALQVITDGTPVLFRPEGDEVVALLGPWSGLLVLPAPWVRAIARRELRRAIGLPLHVELPENARIEGSADEWAVALAAAEAAEAEERRAQIVEAVS